MTGGPPPPPPLFGPAWTSTWALMLPGLALPGGPGGEYPFIDTVYVSLPSVTICVSDPVQDCAMLALLALNVPLNAPLNVKLVVWPELSSVKAKVKENA